MPRSAPTISSANTSRRYCRFYRESRDAANDERIGPAGRADSTDGVAHQVASAVGRARNQIEIARTPGDRSGRSIAASPALRRGTIRADAATRRACARTAARTPQRAESSRRVQPFSGALGFQSTSRPHHAAHSGSGDNRSGFDGAKGRARRAPPTPASGANAMRSSSQSNDTSTTAAAKRSLSEKTSACSDHVTKSGDATASSAAANKRGNVATRKDVRAREHQPNDERVIRACP